MNLNVIRQIFVVRRYSLIAVVILIVANIGFYLYSSTYLGPRLVALEHQWAGKRVDAARDTAADTATVYRQGMSDLTAWRARIYPKRDFVRFIGELFETAKNNSLKIGAINYKPASIKGEALVAYSVGLNVSGKYAAVKSFIADMERLRTMVVIDNVSLSGKSTEESVDMRLQLTAYFRTEG